MSDDYILKYTNGFANNGKISESELEIDGDCKITNYDPRETDGVNKGRITINFSDEETKIEIGDGNKLVSSEKANFSSKKYSIFSKIAALDGDKDELSVDDIEEMDKSLIETWGLKDLRYDYRNGVATLVWGENDILRIDFMTWQEKWFGLSEASKVKPKTQADSKAPEIVGTYVVKENDTMEKIAAAHWLYRWELEQVNDSIAKQKYLHVGDTLQIPKPIPFKNLDNLSEQGQKFLKELRNLESRGRGGYKAENWAGYLGAYQMGKQALKDLRVYSEKDDKYINNKENKAWTGTFVKGNKLGITSVVDFLNSPEKQDKAIIRYMQLTWVYILQNKMHHYVGKNIGGVEITEQGLIAGCHLVGREDMKKFLETDGKFIPTDGNGKKVTEYLSNKKIKGQNLDFRFD